MSARQRVTKQPSAEECKEECSPDLTPRPVDPPVTSQPCGGTVVSSLMCDASDAAIKGTDKLDVRKEMEPDASESSDLADNIRDMDNLIHYELLATEILNRVVPHRYKGESYLFRTLPEPLRSSVSTIVSSGGYDFESFSTLADEITNTRHECAYFFFSHKSFEDNVNAAKNDFSVYYRVQMKHGGFGKTKEYFQCLHDVFNMYHLLKNVFEEYAY